jgi:hypothetical protein
MSVDVELCRSRPGSSTGYRTQYPLHVQYQGTPMQYALRYLILHRHTRLVADGFAAFEGPSAAFGGSACAAGLLIKLPDGTCNIHPSPAGHLLLAQAIEDVAGAAA